MLQPILGLARIIGFARLRQPGKSQYSVHDQFKLGVQLVFEPSILVFCIVGKPVSPSHDS